MGKALWLSLALAAGMLGTEITGKVTAVEGDVVTIAADDPKARARVGDSVVIYFPIPGLDELAKVGSGKVVRVDRGNIAARIDQRTGALAVGQIAKIQASGQPGAGANSAHVAQARPGYRVLHFDQQWLGWLGTDAFKGTGVRWSKEIGDPAVAEPEPNMVLPSARKRVLLLRGGPVTSLILQFAPPIKRFGLTRVGTRGGASVPTWTLEAFDARGRLVASTGEEHGLPPQPQRFSVTGEGIVGVVLRTDNRYGEGTWATWNSLPVAAFELER